MIKYYTKDVIDIFDLKTNYILCVADLYFAVESFKDDYTMQVYKDYIVDSIPKGQSVYKLSCTVTDTPLTSPSGTKLTDREECNWYTTDLGKYSQFFYDSVNKCHCALLNFDNNKRCGEIILYDVKKVYGVDTQFLLYNIMERLFRLAILFNDGFVLHASSIVYKGFGLAFSALSGVGKSTHTGLWLEHYHDVYILNDDCPALRCVDGIWYMYGAPWAGTTGINVNSKVPVKALIFLERSEKNSIRDCEASESVKRIFEAVANPVSDEITNLIFASLSSFLMSSKVCVLGCNISKEAPQTVERYLFN